MQAATAKIIRLSPLRSGNPAVENTPICIHTRDFIEILKPQEIVVAQAEGNYTRFHLKDGRKILSSKTLGTYRGQLLAGSFIRPHQSYLVNMDYITRVRKIPDLMLCLGERFEIPVSRSRKKEVLSYW